MKHRLVQVCAVMLVCMALACGCSQATQVEDKTNEKVTAEQKDAPAVSKEPQAPTITPAKIWIKGQPERAIELMSDGTIALEGKPVGVLHGDGRVVLADGKLVLTLNPDGTVAFSGEQAPEGDDASITISPEGVLEVPKAGLKVHFDETGSLVGWDANEPMVSEGCQGATARTCAHVFVVYVLMVGG